MEEQNNNIFIYLLVAVVIIAAGVLGFILISEDEDTDDTSDTETEQQAEDQDAVDTDEDTASDDTTRPADGVTPDDTEEVTATIVDLAVATDDLSTLAGLVAANESIAATLSSNDAEYTVFAPTNAAFESISETVDSLTDEQIATVLTYHVIPNEVLSENLQPEQTVTTLQGQELTIAVNAGIVTITDASGNVAMVTTADVQASNGVVHIIDGVLIPNLETAETN